MADGTPDPPDDGPGRTGRRRLLVGVCGSANVLALPQYLTTLRAELDVHVRIVMTRSAAALLPPTSMRLLCEEVHCDGQDELTVGHVSLAAWAERFVVLPATANMLGQAAHGLASGLLSSALLAHELPVLFFPSMNRRMWERPPVRRNVSRLRDDGHVVVEPVPVPAWQIATRDVRTTLALPPPATVAAVVDEFFRLPVGPNAPSAV
ncbi:flavoprotein [Streptomyces coeruleoprunus]|uniref:Flavoprotein n=1 Tax=Streptomyces coeruleoprunus TaxID=285563 RepID=A0ABV9X866_9ACTN